MALERESQEMRELRRIESLKQAQTSRPLEVDPLHQEDSLSPPFSALSFRGGSHLWPV